MNAPKTVAELIAVLQYSPGQWPVMVEQTDPQGVVLHYRAYVMIGDFGGGQVVVIAPDEDEPVDAMHP